MSWCACGDEHSFLFPPRRSRGENSDHRGRQQTLVPASHLRGPTLAFGGNPGSGYRCLQTDLEYRQISVSRSISQKTDKLEVPELNYRSLEASG